ncbi:hypothetical protein D9758_005127 [Tetrapyrgos nigripes]|uniref:peptidylprolyl isomerase n=1 Tax=Tetrapyrgos nigripes TaxID=182062 RepID=A0A8H5GWP0_9AGAR|nr:hypothetical protein D9758_005127 [Tetrapyrgos nigripes]
MSFEPPRKAILSPAQLEWFQTSDTHKTVISYIETLNEVIVGAKLSDKCEESTAVKAILQILDKVEQVAKDTPPVENSASRFGNPAFRTFYDKVNELSPALHSEIPSLPQDAVPEISVYFNEAWGNRSRIDYGSGMELNFLCWLICLEKLGILQENDHKTLVLRVFWRYIQVMRVLQSAYWLEPAGSHGVWGLDDYHFLPFLFGSAQLRGHKYIRPKAIHDAEIVEEYAKEYIYFACIRFINSVKTASLRWHSPMLDDISAVKTWDKVNSGMIKMYCAEVLNKLPVMQHFLFGSILPYNGPPPPDSSTVDSHAGHAHPHAHGLPMGNVNGGIHPETQRMSSSPSLPPIYIVHNSTLENFLLYINKQSPPSPDAFTPNSSPPSDSTPDVDVNMRGLYAIPQSSSLLTTPPSSTFFDKQDFEDNHNVEDVKLYIAEDIKHRVRILLPTFLDVILGLPPKEFNDLKLPGKPIGRVKSDEGFKQSWNHYCSIAREGSLTPQGVPVFSTEEDLYRPLVHVICRALDIMFDGKPPLTFFDSHRKRVHGSWSQRGPDFAALPSHLSLTTGEFDGMKKWWPLFLYILEVKHHNGFALDWFYGRSIGVGPEHTKRPSPTPQDQKKKEIRKKWKRKASSLEEATETHSGSVLGPAFSDTQQDARASTSASIDDNDDEVVPASKRPKITDAVDEQESNVNETVESPASTTISGEANDTQIQVASYALDMLSRGLLRTHTVAILVDTTCLQLAYYDRSQVVVSQPLNMYGQDDHLDLFLAVLYQISVQGSMPHMGLLPTSIPNFTITPKSQVFPRIEPYFYQSSEKAFSGSMLHLDAETQLQIGDVIHRAHGVIGRASIVLAATRIRGNWGLELGNDAVVKISFPTTARDPEAHLLKLARAKATGKHAWAMEHLPQVLWDKEYSWDDLGTPQDKLADLLQQLDDPQTPGVPAYERRTLRIIVLRRLHPITELTKPEDYAQVFYDILQIHRWLVDHPKVFQRDISLANIMFSRNKADGTVRGVLNDFDLASRLPLSSESSSRTRTGTKPYMSHELLKPPVGKRTCHLYRHDLEALYYVILIVCSHYEDQKQGIHKITDPKRCIYNSWFVGSHSSIASEKRSALAQDHLSIQQFFTGFTDILTYLRSLLMIGYQESDANTLSIKLQGDDSNFQLKLQLFKASETQAEHKFKEHSLNDRVTYQNFQFLLSEGFKLQNGSPKRMVQRYPDADVLPLNPRDFDPEGDLI